MRITEEPCVGYLHCNNVNECVWSHRQTEVKAIRTTIERTFTDRQGRDDLNPNPTAENPLAQLVETSHITFRLADGEQDKVPCPGCGSDRAGTLTDQVRPVYASLNSSGQHPLELIKRRKERRDLERQLEEELFPEPEPAKPTTKGAA